MTPRLALCLVICSAFLAAPRSAPADVNIQVVFNTVDSVELRNQLGCASCVQAMVVTVKGIPAAGGTPVTAAFNFGPNADMASRCERLALISMSRPGKYQFAIGADNFSGGHGDCKLILITP